MSGKKKVGIVTLHNANNYGALYQVYSLSRYIETLGFEVFVLNYCMETTSLISCLKNPVSVLRKMYSRKMFSRRFIKGRSQHHRGKEREREFFTVFKDFRKQYLDITDVAYKYRALKKNCPSADAYITGSDQVWAADFLFTSPAYLLGFVPKESRRVSYAPSFGKNKLEPYLHQTFKNYAKQFDAISVREMSGVKIVKDVAGLEATKVLDPTLLLDDYAEIIDYSLVPDMPYIITYRLHQEYELACWMTQSVGKLGAALGLPVYSVSTNCPWGLNSGGADLQPTPGQLLGLIERSSLVLTNSFHGTVFSILFRTKFLTYARDKFSDKQNLRMIELLGVVGLEKLFCDPFSSLDSINEGIEHEFSYEIVHAKLAKLRSASVNFLRSALL